MRRSSQRLPTVMLLHLSELAARLDAGLPPPAAKAGNGGLTAGLERLALPRPAAAVAGTDGEVRRLKVELRDKDSIIEGLKALSLDKPATPNKRPLASPGTFFSGLAAQYGEPRPKPALQPAAAELPGE